MRVRLNLATKALETHRRFLVGAGLVIAVAGLVFLGLGWHVHSVRKAEEDLRTRTEKMRQDTAKLEEQRGELERFFSLQENKGLHDRAAFLNTIIDARSFNWTQMFMDLERILPDGVHLLSIEPKQVKGHIEVNLSVGARNDEAKLKFLRALEDSKEFKGIVLETDKGPNPGQGPTPGGEQRTVVLTAEYSRI
jgi:type IV pilus assembly protein PilN